MEHFATDITYGIRTLKNNNHIQLEVNNNKTIIILKINDSIKKINRDYIINNITPNISVEMLYYVLYEFLKYDNYKLIKDNSNYIFEGYYNEPYEQGEEIHIMIII